MLQNDHTTSMDLTASVNSALAATSLWGTWLYVILWPPLAMVGGYIKGPYALPFWWAQGLFVVLALMRLWHCSRLKVLDPHIWRRRYVFIVLSNITLWTLLTVGILLHQNGSTLAYSWLVVSAGLAAGGVISMASSFWLANAYQTILLVPILLICLFDGDKGNNLIGWLTTVFWAHMLLAGRTQTKLYRQVLMNNSMLEAYAERLKSDSEIDALTGLANRRQLERVMAKEWDRLSRSGGPLALVMIDLDHFKAVNDDYGHPVGDKCLVKVAELLREHIHRPADLLGRYGGEEFMVLLPDTELEGAMVVAETLCQSLAKRPLKLGGLSLSVTLSAGVAVASPSQEANAESLVQRADKALYRAKELGRNRVECDFVTVNERPGRRTRS